MQVPRGRGDSRYKSLRQSMPDILKEQQRQSAWNGLSKGSGEGDAVSWGPIVESLRRKKYYPIL